MLVRVYKDRDQPTVELLQAADLTNLSVEAIGLEPVDVRRALLNSELGELAESGETAWLSVEALRAVSEHASIAAGERAAEKWTYGWGGMLRYAKSQGWVSEDDRLVRAHVRY